MPRNPALALLLLLPAAPAVAQTVGTPVYMAPYRAFTSMEIGGMISDPGQGLAVEGSYRYGTKQFDIGIRAGFHTDSDADQTNLLLGADVRFRILEHTDDFPLDGALTGGIGSTIGDFSQLYIPVGVSFGRRVELEGGASFVPYAQPILAPSFGDGNDEILFALGLGVDFKVSRSIEIRVSGGIGDIEGIALGLSWIR